MKQRVRENDTKDRATGHAQLSTGNNAMMEVSSLLNFDQWMCRPSESKHQALKVHRHGISLPPSVILQSKVLQLLVTAHEHAHSKSSKAVNSSVERWDGRKRQPTLDGSPTVPPVGSTFGVPAASPSQPLSLREMHDVP